MDVAVVSPMLITPVLVLYTLGSKGPNIQISPAPIDSLMVGALFALCTVALPVIVIVWAPTSPLYTRRTVRPLLTMLWSFAESPAVVVMLLPTPPQLDSVVTVIGTTAMISPIL